MLDSFDKKALLCDNFHNIKKFITPITHLQFIYIYIYYLSTLYE